MGGNTSRSGDINRAVKENRKLLSEGRMNKRTLAMLLDENEPIRLTLDDQAFVFIEGMWIPDLSAKDYRKLNKQNQFLVAENGLLKVKVDILLELITGRVTDKPKKLLTQRRNSLIKNINQGDTSDSTGSFELLTHDRPTGSKAALNSKDLKGILFAIGDPLLDIVVEVPTALLQKHRLDPDAGTLLGDAQMGLVEELLGGAYHVAYVPGGSEQNCLKIIQRLVGVPHATTYLGCIGRDKNGEILEAAMKESGVNARYQYVDGQATGLCYVCLTGVKRSLVTKLGAAENPVLELLRQPENWALVEKAKYYYVESYSIANRFKEMLMIARHALEHNKVLAMNLSCPYLSSKYMEKLNEALPYVDILFGSELEALAFGAARGLESKEIEHIALTLARTPKLNGRRGRLVILTRGKNPVVAVSDGQTRQFPVIPTPAEDIQDTVGAGDAFAGGYLAARMTGHKHDECMRVALEAANFVIRLRGCGFHDDNFNGSVVGRLQPTPDEIEEEGKGQEEEKGQNEEHHPPPQKTNSQSEK